MSLKADSYPLYFRAEIYLSIGVRFYVNSFHPFPFNHQRLSILWSRRISLLEKWLQSFPWSVPLPTSFSQSLGVKIKKQTMTSVLHASRRSTPTLERRHSGRPSWEFQFRLGVSLPMPLDSSNLEGQHSRPCWRTWLRTLFSKIQLKEPEVETFLHTTGCSHLPLVKWPLGSRQLRLLCLTLWQICLQ